MPVCLECVFVVFLVVEVAGRVPGRDDHGSKVAQLVEGLGVIGAQKASRHRRVRRPNQLLLLLRLNGRPLDGHKGQVLVRNASHQHCRLVGVGHRHKLLVLSGEKGGSFFVTYLGGKQ